MNKAIKEIKDQTEMTDDKRAIFMMRDIIRRIESGEKVPLFIHAMNQDDNTSEMLMHNGSIEFGANTLNNLIDQCPECLVLLAASKGCFNGNK